MRELYGTMVNNIYVVNINDSVNVRVGHNDSEAVYDLVNQQRNISRNSRVQLTNIQKRPVLNLQ